VKTKRNYDLERQPLSPHDEKRGLEWFKTMGRRWFIAKWRSEKATQYRRGRVFVTQWEHEGEKRYSVVSSYHGCSGWSQGFSEAEAIANLETVRANGKVAYLTDAESGLCEDNLNWYYSR